MRRRDLLAMGAAMAGMFAARSVLGQETAPLKRAAVVIGVDKVGDLPVLSAAKTGARTVATWLDAEGFEVKTFLDDGKAVRVSEIFDAVDGLVRRGTLDQLIIYFSGHGFLSNYAEFWMLSNAPDNPNEAISLVESLFLARQSAIPNVVFISDACRSTPESLGAGLVRGSLIFPNRGVSQNLRPDVDQFLATLPGDRAFELPLTESIRSFEGIYTSCFLDAFRHPDEEMVRTVNGIRVVPNNKLKAYLEREVRKKAEAKSIRLRQIPDTNVVSGDMTYIGRASDSPQARRLRFPDTSLEGTLFDVAGFKLKRVGADVLSSDLKVLSTIDLDRVASETGFDAARNLILDARADPTILRVTRISSTGFNVFGAPLSLAQPNRKMRAEVLSEPTWPIQAVQIESDGERAGSVALRFGGGTGTVVAAIPGFIGTVVVDGGGVANVSYAPSARNWRSSDYQAQRARIDEQHAAVAAAARFGVFRIEGDKDIKTQRAAELGDRIRVLKGIDPTLGLYAAYAYAEADLTDKVTSVRTFMREDLNTDLFDVALLAGALSGKNIGDSELLAPFCPMLSQGWALLRVNGVRLPPGVARARDHLRPSLWTTFDAEGMDMIIGALREGNLQ
jgi:hypothetical protein